MPDWDHQLPPRTQAAEARRTELLHRYPILQTWHEVPTNTGGVQFETTSNGWAFELEIDAKGRTSWMVASEIANHRDPIQFMAFVDVALGPL